MKVLIVDNHEVVRNGLKRILQDAPEEAVVGEAAEGQGALDLVQAEPWDVIILDINLPDIRGTEVLRAIIRDNPDTPVLMFSLYADRMTITHSLKAGAAGYLSKATVADELLPAIEAVRQGKRFVSPALVEEFDLTV